ncbi:hypothetical protein evm_012609 [Chilo suppressalis]|nr:hypothetical protein evm_012609 [Chilo suppressalis]
MDHRSVCNHAQCTAAMSNQSLSQTLSEMDWERGIWYAAFNGDKERVELLIEKSKNRVATVNTQDNSGYTALHYAARNGHVDICQTLLRNGACINAQTRSGKATPLHKAVTGGKIATVKFLIESGASIDMQDVDGQTVLHRAVEYKRDDLISVLLNASPNLRLIKDNKGNCAVLSQPSQLQRKGALNKHFFLASTNILLQSKSNTEIQISLPCTTTTMYTGCHDVIYY